VRGEDADLGRHALRELGRDLPAADVSTDVYVGVDDGPHEALRSLLVRQDPVVLGHPALVLRARRSAGLGLRGLAGSGHSLLALCDVLPFWASGKRYLQAAGDLVCRRAGWVVMGTRPGGVRFPLGLSI